MFFGSFNPIHVGHLIIGNIMVETTDLEQVWYVVSPQNPLKPSGSLIHEFDRYDMVQAAVNEAYHLKVSDIEFNMPKPSFTVDTLAYLADRHPEHKFSLIIGEDNLRSFPKWKNYRTIMDNYGLFVYPRPDGTRSELEDHPNVHFVKAPILDISATYIRDLVRHNHSIQFLVPDSVAQLIKARKLYQ